MPQGLWGPAFGPQKWLLVPNPCQFLVLSITFKHTPLHRGHNYCVCGQTVTQTREETVERSRNLRPKVFPTIDVGLCNCWQSVRDWHRTDAAFCSGLSTFSGGAFLSADSSHHGHGWQSADGSNSMTRFLQRRRKIHNTNTKTDAGTEAGWYRSNYQWKNIKTSIWKYFGLKTGNKWENKGLSWTSPQTKISCTCERRPLHFHTTTLWPHNVKSHLFTNQYIFIILWDSWVSVCPHVYLPLPPQDVLLHPLLGELLGLHGVRVLFQPGVFETLRAGQPSPGDGSGTLYMSWIHWLQDYLYWHTYSYIRLSAPDSQFFQHSLPTNMVSYNTLKTGWYTRSYFMSFFSSLVMKSLALSEISSKASSSKSQVAEVTLDRVSLSLSPIKGDRPLSLRGQTQDNISQTKSSQNKPCTDCSRQLCTNSI